MPVLACVAPSVQAHDVAHGAQLATVAKPSPAAKRQAASRTWWHRHVLATPDYGIAIQAIARRFTARAA
jgi:hypothetical protein